MAKKFCSQLSHDLTKLLSDTKFCDVTIVVGKAPDIKSFQAHSSILYYRSPYFRRELSNPSFNSVSKKFKFNISIEVFETLLTYIYNGTIMLEDKSGHEIFRILLATEKLGLYEIITHLQQFLLDHHVDWLKRHIESVNRASFRNDHFQVLQQFCTTNDPGKVLNDINFHSISENAMISLLKRDHFGMDEVQMWDNVLKWGLTQNPTLLTMEPTKWTTDDFKVLRVSLQQFLPLIGFHEMKSHQFFEKVSPFSKIFEPRIYEELVQYFMLSDENVSNMNIPDLSLSIKYPSLNSMVTYIDSCILSTKHAALIAIWIQQVEQTEYLGPSFGFDDITISGENYREEMKCYSGNNSYERPIRSEGYFSIDEYEIFQVSEAIRFISYLAKDVKNLIVDSYVCEHILDVACDSHGCFVVKKCFEYGTYLQKSLVQSAIVANTLPLSQNFTGRIILQYVLNVGEPLYFEAIKKQLHGTRFEIFFKEPDYHIHKSH
ncbi:12199_t:CDS:2 [Gigaspora margarita]|uniref:12199_t:CDS:1 n=1 Tax=Gigaspora margarita TaxID=4874 RepID=A0ABN7V3Q5_GIGMA|nr:12199_t:CDS:2 [Gigaspora margarita]